MLLDPDHIPNTDPRQPNECGSRWIGIRIHNAAYNYSIPVLYYNERFFSLYLHRSFMVSFMAFSGATPNSWGTRPRYRPVTPSCLTT
jgi:hypothetical protein